MFEMYQCITALYVLTSQSDHSPRHDNAKRSMCRCDETLRRCVLRKGQHCFTDICNGVETSCKLFLMFFCYVVSLFHILLAMSNLIRNVEFAMSEMSNLVRNRKVLRTCCSAFPITIKWCFDQDVKVVPCATFTKRTCNRCGSLQNREDVAAISRLELNGNCGFRMTIAQHLKTTRDEHVLGFKSCDISIYWLIRMLSFLPKHIWIGIIIFFWTSLQLLVQFWDCRLQWTEG